MQQLKTSKWRLVQTLMIALALMVVLSACGGNEAEPNGTNKSGNDASAGSNSEQTAGETPQEISMMMAFWSKEPPRTPDALAAIEAYTGTKLDLTWVPASGYNEKLNATVASGTHPNVMVVNDLKSSVIINSIQAGMFWELGPYLQDFPNLSRLNESSLYNTSIDGKIYGLPRERVITRNGLILRKDWLENTGASEPTNLAELYALMRTFADGDPDQNNQQDTSGTSENATLLLFDFILGAKGGANQWRLQPDGSFTPAFEEEAYLQTMNDLRQLIADGLLNDDFAIYPNRDEDFNKSKVGIAANVLDATLSAAYVELRTLQPDAELQVLGRLSGESGGIIAGSGSNGVFMIPKTSVKTEDELRQVLTFMDKLIDPEMLDLFTWGIEGKHYQKNGETYEFINKEAYVEEVDPLTQFVFMGYNYLYTRQAQSELGDTIEQLWRENEAYAILNPAQPLISATYSERGSELDKLISDARVKYILGEYDTTDWEAVIAQWKKTGGDQVAQEYKEAHAKLNQ